MKFSHGRNDRVLHSRIEHAKVFSATQSTLTFVDNNARAQLLLRWPRNVVQEEFVM